MGGATGMPASRLIASIEQALDRHSTGAEQHDDITVMAVRRES